MKYIAILFLVGGFLFSTMMVFGESDDMSPYLMGSVKILTDKHGGLLDMNKDTIESMLPQKEHIQGFDVPLNPNIEQALQQEGLEDTHIDTAIQKLPLGNHVKHQLRFIAKANEIRNNQIDMIMESIGGKKDILPAFRCTAYGVST